MFLVVILLQRKNIDTHTMIFFYSCALLEQYIAYVDKQTKCVDDSNREMKFGLSHGEQNSHGLLKISTIFAIQDDFSTKNVCGGRGWGGGARIRSLHLVFIYLV